jgi:hypothetical protein
MVAARSLPRPDPAAGSRTVGRSWTAQGRMIAAKGVRVQERVNRAGDGAGTGGRDEGSEPAAWRVAPR